MVDRDCSDPNGELDANPHDARTPVDYSPMEPDAEQCPEEEDDSKQCVSGALRASDRHDRVVDETLVSQLGRPDEALAKETARRPHPAADQRSCCHPATQSLETCPASRCFWTTWILCLALPS